MAGGEAGWRWGLAYLYGWMGRWMDIWVGRERDKVEAGDVVERWFWEKVQRAGGRGWRVEIETEVGMNRKAVKFVCLSVCLFICLFIWR